MAGWSSGRGDYLAAMPSAPEPIETALSRIDIEKVRADTPAADHRIHVNNAGASLPTEAVIRATVDYLETESRRGGYETATARAGDLDRVYRETARMLGCDEAELAFQQNATQAWWAAFNSVPLAPGDRILASSAEYVASGIALVQIAEQGIEVELIPDDEHGQTSVEALAELLDERVKLVCVTHVPTSGGLVNPIEAIGAAVRQGSAARYLVDACQSAGQLPLDVDAIGADFLSFTGRKFCRAPRGTGMLYQRAGLVGLVPPRVSDGWGTDWVEPWTVAPKPGARVHELYEYSFAAKVGFGVALGYANDLGLDNIAARTGALAELLRERLAIDRRGGRGRSRHRSQWHRHVQRRWIVTDPGGRTPHRSRDQHICRPGGGRAIRSRRSSPGRVGPGVGALLQHRRRTRPGRRSGG